jgi:NAD(P)H-dependent FMN reductase
MYVVVYLVPKISVIIGSVRRNRFADKPAAWIHGHLAGRADVQAELLDLAEYPMPFYAEPISPSRKQGPYADSVVEAWTARIGVADGFIIVTPEYNHSFPAVLKNALDFVYREWARKPVAFVSYGAVGGARAVEQLRLVAVELQMAPIHATVHLPYELLIAHRGGQPIEPKLALLNPAAETMLDDLLWWTNALRAARH